LFDFSDALLLGSIERVIKRHFDVVLTLQRSHRITNINALVGSNDFSLLYGALDGRTRRQFLHSWGCIQD